jgi:hypothetical protein
MEGEVIVDWYSALADAITKRVEVRRQKWNIKRRELELVAAKLNRRPTLDFLAQYRYRGLGDDLIGSRDPANQFNSLYQNIFEGNYQEWQAGVEFGNVVGLRQAGAAVANARWNLARERALLQEQELRITHDLSTAARQIQRAYQLMQGNFVRLQADKAQVSALRDRVVGGQDNINFLLQAQQQLATTENSYFRALVDYQLALRDFHREKGSLLNYNQVGMSEAAWPGAAYQDAQERGRFFTPRSNPESVTAGPRLSDGAFDPTAVGAGVPDPSANMMPAAAPSSQPAGDIAPSPSDKLGSSMTPMPTLAGPVAAASVHPAVRPAPAMLVSTPADNFMNNGSASDRPTEQASFASPAGLPPGTVQVAPPLGSAVQAQQ